MKIESNDNETVSLLILVLNTWPVPFLWATYVLGSSSQSCPLRAGRSSLYLRWQVSHGIMLGMESPRRGPRGEVRASSLAGWGPGECRAKINAAPDFNQDPRMPELR